MDPRPQTDQAGPAPVTNPAVAGASFTVGDLLARTWSLYRTQWATIMAVYWGAGAANLMCVLTLDLLLAAINDLVRDPILFDLLRFLHFLAIWVIPAWLWIGQSLALLKIAREEPVSLEDLFRGRPYLLTTILATLLLMVAAAVPFLIVQVLTTLTMNRFAAGQLDPLLVLLKESWLAGGSVVPTLVELVENGITWLVIGLVGTALSFVAVFPVLVRSGQYPYAVIDLGVGVVQAHLASWRMSRGHVATVFLVYLAYLTINLAGSLAFFAGLLLTLPWTNLLLAVTYHALSEASGEVRAYEEVEDEEAR